MSAVGRRWRSRLAAVGCAGRGRRAVGVAARAAAAPLSAPFGLTPWPGGNGTVAPYFTLHVPAGGSASASALISNPGQTTEKLIISRSTGITAANGGTPSARPSGAARAWAAG